VAARIAGEGLGSKLVVGLPASAVATPGSVLT